MTILHDHRDEIIDRYRNGESTTQIAPDFDRNPETVRVFLKSQGVEMRWSHGKHDHGLVLKLWHEYHNQHRVAKEAGVSQTHVCRILHRHGIRVGRGARQPLVALPRREVTAMYHKGHSCQEIGEHLGCHGEVVRERLKKWGVDRRRRGQYEKRGAANPQWKGGKAPPMHYYRRQSYEIAAICLRHPLPPGCVIHHIDGDPENNVPNNLLLFESPALHASHHQQLVRHQLANTTEEAIRLALENGGHRLPTPAVPIRLLPDTSLHDLLDTLETPS